jgi:uncharacterized membrane protein
MNANTTQKRRKKLETWTIPFTYVLITLVFGMLFPRLEHYFLPNLVSTMSAAAAMGICGAVASGMIALTGIVFSLAFIMVQFSATAYSPRLVLWVARDPVVSHALGIFITTFLYALIMLGWVDRNASGKVPLVSSWMVFVLLLASMAVFIALVERIGLLKVSRMLIFTGNRGRAAIEELYNSPDGPGQTGIGNQDYRKTEVTQTLIYSGRPQVIQAVRAATLVELASAAGAVIEVTAAIGDSILETAPLLRVYGGKEKVDEEALRRGIEIGDERTFEQDPKYALRLLVDIAIKALSPAINDPTTAVQALDQIEDLLLRLGRCNLHRGQYLDKQGALRLVIPFPAWEDFLRLALDEIRYCGATSVQVTRRMMALIKNLLLVLPVERHAALSHWEQRVQGTILRTFEDAEEKKEAAVADRQGLGVGEENVPTKAEAQLGTRKLGSQLILLITLLFPVAARTQETSDAEQIPEEPPAQRPFEISPFYGYRWGGDFQTAGGQKLGLEGGKAYGLSIDYSPNADLKYELLWSRQESGVDLQDVGGSNQLGVTVDEFQIGGVLETTYGRLHPYITGLLGATLFSPEGSDSEVRFSISIGGGVKFFLFKNLALRADIRGYCSVVDSDSAFISHGGVTLVHFSGSTMWQGEVSGGMTLAF